MRSTIHISDTYSLFDFDDITIEHEFSEAREERRTPTNEELRALDLRTDDELEPPLAMTSNDAFRIIEFIKEREALRSR